MDAINFLFSGSGGLGTALGLGGLVTSDPAGLSDISSASSQSFGSVLGGLMSGAQSAALNSTQKNAAVPEGKELIKGLSIASADAGSELSASAAVSADKNDGAQPSDLAKGMSINSALNREITFSPQSENAVMNFIGSYFKANSSDSTSSDADDEGDFISKWQEMLGNLGSAEISQLSAFSSELQTALFSGSKYGLEDIAGLDIGDDLIMTAGDAFIQVLGNRTKKKSSSDSDMGLMLAQTIAASGGAGMTFADLMSISSDGDLMGTYANRTVQKITASALRSVTAASSFDPGTLSIAQASVSRDVFPVTADDSTDNAAAMNGEIPAEQVSRADTSAYESSVRDDEVITRAVTGGESEKMPSAAESTQTPAQDADAAAADSGAPVLTLEEAAELLKNADDRTVEDLTERFSGALRDFIEENDIVIETDHPSGGRGSDAAAPAEMPAYSGFPAEDIRRGIRPGMRTARNDIPVPSVKLPEKPSSADNAPDISFSDAGSVRSTSETNTVYNGIPVDARGSEGFPDSAVRDENAQAEGGYVNMAHAVPGQETDAAYNYRNNSNAEYTAQDTAPVLNSLTEERRSETADVSRETQPRVSPHGGNAAVSAEPEEIPSDARAYDAYDLSGRSEDITFGNSVHADERHAVNYGAPASAETEYLTDTARGQSYGRPQVTDRITDRNADDAQGVPAENVSRIDAAEDVPAEGVTRPAGEPSRDTAQNTDDENITPVRSRPAADGRQRTDERRTRTDENAFSAQMRPESRGSVFADEDVTGAQTEDKIAGSINSQAAEAILERISADPATGETELTVRLNPRSLGEITVKITKSQNGDVSVTLAAHSQETARLIGEHADELVRMLSERNESAVDVNVVDPAQSAGQYMSFDTGAGNAFRFGQERPSDTARGTHRVSRIADGADEGTAEAAVNTDEEIYISEEAKLWTTA